MRYCFVRLILVYIVPLPYPQPILTRGYRHLSASPLIKPCRKVKILSAHTQDYTPKSKEFTLLFVYIRELL